MNRYIDRYISVALLIYFIPSVSFAQITIEGPTTGNTGDLIYVKLTKVDVEDLKLITLKDGEPTDKGFQPIMDWNGNKSVQLFSKDNGLYTIILTGNKDKKTFTATHTVRLGQKPPDPIIPPGPESQLLKDLKAVYTQADKDNVKLLTKVFEEVGNGIKERPDVKDDYNNFGELEQVLYSSINETTLKQTALRPLRDVIGKYMEKQFPNKNVWDKPKAKTAFNEVINALQLLVQ